MAIKIQGSTIIDDSRNIVNAGFITATTFVGNLTGTATSSRNLDNQPPSYYLDYNNFTNTPTSLSAFTNDVGFSTVAYVDNLVAISTVGLTSIAYVDNAVAISTVGLSSIAYVDNAVAISTVGLSSIAYVDNLVAISTVGLTSIAYVDNLVAISTVGLTSIAYVDNLVAISTVGLSSIAYVDNLVAISTVGLTSIAYVDNAVAISTFSGNYNDLTNQPSIPSIAGLASEGYVDASISNLIDTAPSTLDTLNELAAALGDDPNFATTITNSLSTKASITYVDNLVAISTVGLSSIAYVDNLVAISTFSGDYNDLTNTPTIPSIAGLASEGYVDNKVAISTFSGDYNDLTNTPTIPSIAGLASEGYVDNLVAISTFSGDYNDLTNKPTIPSDTGDLTNNVGFVTSSIVVGYATEGYVNNLVAISTFSGDYNDLTNTPTALSSFSNDVGFSTVAYVDNAVAISTVGLTSIAYVDNAVAISTVGLTSIAYVDNLVAISTFSGNYNDLTNQPSIPSIAGLASEGYVNNLVSISTFSGDYNDLTNTPTIPSIVGLASEGYVDNLVAISTFSGDYNDLINTPSIPTDTGDLTNSVGFVTSSVVVGYATEGYVNNLVSISTFSGDYNDLINQPSIPSIAGLASEGYVDTSIANLVDTAPATLDTLNELAAALGDDPNFATTVTNSLALKAPINNTNLTGVTTTPLLNVGVGGTIITTTGIGNVGIGSTLPASTLTVNAPSGYTGNILDLRVGGSSKFYINKDGFPFWGNVVSNNSDTFNTNQKFAISGFFVSNRTGNWSLSFGTGNSAPSVTGGWLNSTSFVVRRDSLFGWTNQGIGTAANNDVVDLSLFRDDANVLAQRKGTSPNIFRVYNTYTSATNFERAQVGWTTNTFIVGTEKGSAGGTARQLELQTDGTTRVAITTDGNVGIGSTQPSNKLDVAGSVNLIGGASAFRIDGSKVLDRTSLSPTITDSYLTSIGTLTRLNVGNVNSTGVITATSFVKDSGTSSQFLKADGSVDSSTYLTSYTETNDLTSAVTWANVPDANITESSVTQHQAALSITESQISDLQTYLTTTGSGSNLTGIVTSIVAGSGISIDQSTGRVTITNTSGGGGGISESLAIAYAIAL